jgi:2-oxoglutarate ferredoxin oxidoreductase subunit beta
MLFGPQKNKGIRLVGYVPEIIDLNGQYSIDDVLVHNEKDYVIASMLANFTYQKEFPDPIGVLYSIDAPVYEDLVTQQVNKAIKTRGVGSIQELLNSGATWEVK